jgi:hypothetical protein
VAPAGLWPAATCDIPTQHAADLSSEATRDIPTQHAADLSSEATRDIPTQHAAGLSSAATRDIPTQHAADLSSAATRDIPTQHAADLSSAATRDIPTQDAAAPLERRVPHACEASSASRTIRSVDSAARRAGPASSTNANDRVNHGTAARSAARCRELEKFS